MSPGLVLALALWAGSRPCGARQGRLSVQCRASRYPVAVDCSWSLPPALRRTGAASFIATYRLGVAAQESRPCLQPAPGAPRCAIADLRLFSPEPLVLNVTAVHPGGSRSCLLPFVAERVIKPDPPEAVRLRALGGGRLQVRWAPPGSWPFPGLFTLKYRLRVQRPGAARPPPGGAHRGHDVHLQGAAASPVPGAGGRPGPHGARGAERLEPPGLRPLKSGHRGRGGPPGHAAAQRPDTMPARREGPPASLGLSFPASEMDALKPGVVAHAWHPCTCVPVLENGSGINP